MVVRMRANRSHTANRRSHHALTGPRISLDIHTKVSHQRHRMCMVTGKYRGVQIIDMASKATKQATKASNVSAKTAAKK